MTNAFNMGVWDDDWITVAAFGWYEGGGFVPSSTGSGWDRGSGKVEGNKVRKFDPGVNAHRSRGGPPKNRWRG